MNEQLQRVIISKGITFRGTGIRFKPPTESPKTIKEQKVYVASGGIIPSPIPSQTASEEKAPLLDVKNEPLDAEEAESPVDANAPPTFQEPGTFPVKEEEPDHYSPEDQPGSSSALPTSANTPRMAKRPRKLVRNSDFIYGDPMEAPIRQPEQSEYSEQAEQDEPVGKKRKNYGNCRCEYIVPELERRMNGMMEKMSVIEALAQSLLNQSESRAEDHKVQMMNANSEITMLKRQLVIERNEKNMKHLKVSKTTENPPNLQRQQ